MLKWYGSRKTGPSFWCRSLVSPASDKRKERLQGLHARTPIVCSGMMCCIGGRSVAVVRLLEKLETRNSSFKPVALICVDVRIVRACRDGCPAEIK
jgi:hypothetical protein